jgi:hypothetical protein
VIEPLRIRALQVAHPCSERGLRRLHEDVQVVRHQAVRVAVPGEPRRRALEDAEEPDVVVIVAKDDLASIPPREHVKETAGELDAL